MKVKIIRTGEVTTVSDCYGARLVEQGEAVPAPAEKPKKKANGTD